MTQSYSNIPVTQTLQTSRQLILDRDDAAASNFSGTSFPSSGLLVGMRCHRTDLNKIYSLKDLTPTWVEIADISGTSGLAPQATKLATARAVSITGDGTATAINFDGTAAVALALTLASSGATAGTYTKVTVDAKGRVTAGTAITNADLPTAISQTTLRATSGNIATLSSTSHGFQIGTDAALNLALSSNIIQVRSNGAAADLRLNLYGGSVVLGDGTTSQITLDGTLNAGSLMKATQAEAEAGTVSNKLMTPLQTAQAIAGLAGVGGVNLRYFTASGTYTPTAGYRYAFAIVTGGGSSGTGGSNGTGNGGYGATTVMAVFSLSGLAPQAVTVGAGGSSSSSTVKQAGGNSSIGTIAIAAGGYNSGSSGQFIISGSSGSLGSNDVGGDGGGSFWGPGAGYDSNNTGNAGEAWGAAGAGGQAGSGTFYGGPGWQGIVMILEFK